MGAINDALAFGDLGYAVHENGALLLELLDHKPVVDNLLADIDGRAECFEGDPDDIDGTDYSGAESTGLQQQ
jgi:hypothetical protein